MLQQHPTTATLPVKFTANQNPPSDFESLVNSTAELLTRWQPKFTRLVVETFRHLWDRGELRELARLYKAVHAKYLSAVEASLPEALDREDHARNKIVLDRARKRIYELFDRATDGNGKVLRPYFKESCPLTEEQRQHFGRLWNANEEKLRIRARCIDATKEDELLSDTVARLLKPDVFAIFGDSDDQDRFLWMAYKCMRMAHRKAREEKRRARHNIGRYLLRKARPDAAGKSRSRVVEFVQSMEALSILVDRIAKIGSDRRRDAVISYYLDDDTTKEIAERRETSEATVSKAYRGALHDLRETVPDSLDPGGYTSDQMSARMARLRRDGETFSNIGDKFGITRKAVEKRVRRFEEMAVAR